MVRGIDKFREQFREYSDRYVLIGGVACEILMDEAGLDFRATKDLDIVLSLEAIDASFARAFWAFVRAGNYQIQQSQTGERRCYRFLKPEHDEYPVMLELFARKPDWLELADATHLTPIPADGEFSSLSAILLDDTYYTFLHSGKRIINGISVVGPEQLIPLKARAWLDLTRRKKEGEAIDAKAIAKHKNDLFRLYRVLDPAFNADIPPSIRDDMEAFLNAMEIEPVDLKNIGIKSPSLTLILGEFRRLYVRFP